MRVIGSENRLRILLVDEQPEVLAALVDSLAGSDFVVLTDTDPRGALRRLTRHAVAVIVCGQHMSGMSGAEFLRRSIGFQPDAARIMLTCHRDLPTAMESIPVGRISQFLLHPWKDDVLRAMLVEAAQKFVARCEVRRLEQLTRRQQEQMRIGPDPLEDRNQHRTVA